VNRFVIADPEKCIGCHTCESACVKVHQKVGLAAYPRLTVTRTKAGTMPVQCRHCDDAPCAKVCPVNAITIVNREVQLNESVCIGCKMCVLACPFGVITPHGSLPGGPAHAWQQGSESTPAGDDYLHPLLAWTIGQRTVAVKRDLCHFRPEGPECIRVCPTHALHIVDEAAVNASNEKKRVASVADAAAGDIFGYHRT
jgi:hydrogenase-4 component A